MRINHLLATAAAILLLATACNSADTGKDTNNSSTEKKETAKDVSIKTFEDSVGYFMGQDAAIGYWKFSESDTILKGDKNAEEFRKGVEEGLEAAFKSEAYVIGFQQGVIAYGNIKGINTDLGLAIDKDMFIKGFIMAMKSKDAVDAVKFQADMSEINSRLNTLMNDKNAVADSVAATNNPITQ